MRNLLLASSALAALTLGLVTSGASAAPAFSGRAVSEGSHGNVQNVFFLRRLECELGGHHCRWHHRRWYR